MVIIGEKKVLTNNMAGRSIAEGLLVLVSTYYAYQLEFPKNVGAVMTFLARRMGNAPFEKKSHDSLHQFYVSHQSHCRRKQGTK